MADREVDYALKRAGEEAVRALHADHPAAANAHQALVVHYSARALTLRARGDEGRPLPLKLRAHL